MYLQMLGFVLLTAKNEKCIITTFAVDCGSENHWEMISLHPSFRSSFYSEAERMVTSKLGSLLIRGCV